MEDALSNPLKVAQETLLFAIKASKQGAYHRRWPEPDSLPHFAHARSLLEGVLKQDPDNREALVMMSQLLESLLDFDRAVTSLTRAFDFGEPKTKKSLKRLALLRENAKAWRDLLLTPETLHHLGCHLRAQGVGPGHNTIQVTRKWLQANGIENPDEVLAAFERMGAFSDFQVLTNLVHG